MTRRVLPLLLAALSCRTAAPVVAKAPPAPKAPEPIHLTLVGTNDLHGYVLPQTETIGEATLRYGGLATFAAYLKALRAENPDGVVLVDGGDLFQGTLISNLSEGAVVVEAYNRLGYDATAIGNHEFDYGPVGPMSMAIRPDLDPVGALKARIAQAKFPFLGANVFAKNSEEHPDWLTNDGTTIITRKGVKVGIIGMSTPLTPGVTVAVNVASLRFAPLASVAVEAAARLRARGAEVVIVAMHAGGRCTDTVHHDDLSSCDQDSGEVFEMMKNVPPGTLDAVVAGHTHAPIAQFVNGTPVIESWAQGRYAGVVELFVDPVTRRVMAPKTVMQPPLELCETFDEATKSCDARQLKGKQVKVVPATFRGQPIVADAALAAELLEPAQQKVAELQARPLGIEVKDPLPRKYEDEGPLGDVLTDTLRKVAKADVALLNPGGLRADLPKGPLTYGAAYEVMPFDNQIAVMTLTGVELQTVLKAIFAQRKGMMQVSGIEITVSKCPTDRLRSFTVAGKPVNPKKTYTLATTDFLARGGEGLAPTLSSIDPSKIDLGDHRSGNLREELIAHWEHEHAPLTAPKAGRVKLVDEPCK